MRKQVAIVLRDPVGINRLPESFPQIPEEVLNRFPSMREWDPVRWWDATRLSIIRAFEELDRAITAAAATTPPIPAPVSGGGSEPVVVPTTIPAVSVPVEVPVVPVVPDAPPAPDYSPLYAFFYAD